MFYLRPQINKYVDLIFKTLFYLILNFTLSYEDGFYIK